EVRALSAGEARPLWIIAESDLNDPRLLWSRERGGFGLHAQWSDDFHHALHAALTGESDGYYRDFGRIEDIARALRHAWVYADRYSPHRRRRHGRSPGDLPGYRFLGYIQNHDQVGNRAAGERIGHLAGPNLQKVAAALVLTSPFVPMIFQGEEWGTSAPFQYFTDHQDPALADAVRQGRRREFAAFGWDPDAVPDPQDPATFQRSRLRWEERDEEEHAEMELWYRRLIALRRSRPELLDGRRDRVRTEVDEDGGTLIVRRGQVAVCCNLSGAARSLGGVAGEVILASHPRVACSDGALSLPPESVVILSSAQSEPDAAPAMGR
ncbi:MAG TPA: DUF3459 domain-containing protein, partial [Longimicrobiales bacterium]|nr:DUF3459 domain-containing protein [Longimicrobiales bacterium]